jgi:hypothetical protein
MLRQVGSGRARRFGAFRALTALQLFGAPMVLISDGLDT